VLQVHGRYSDDTPYDFMRPMGIWFENLALPAVINECLLQSYTGTLRLFPNWPLSVNAEFHTLRAVGGFLVSAACSTGVVQWVRILSEAGAPLKLVSPWQPGEIIERPTQPGQEFILTHD
jgi:alpha-L-fucosidase 2